MPDHVSRTFPACDTPSTRWPHCWRGPRPRGSGSLPSGTWMTPRRNRYWRGIGGERWERWKQGRAGRIERECAHRLSLLLGLCIVQLAAWFRQASINGAAAVGRQALLGAHRPSLLRLRSSPPALSTPGLKCPSCQAPSSLSVCRCLAQPTGSGRQLSPTGNLVRSRAASCSGIDSRFIDNHVWCGFRHADRLF